MERLNWETIILANHKGVFTKADEKSSVFCCNVKKSIVKLTPVFQTKEQEELFSRCAQETMFRYMNEENAKKKILK